MNRSGKNFFVIADIPLLGLRLRLGYDYRFLDSATGNDGASRTNATFGSRCTLGNGSFRSGWRFSGFPPPRQSCQDVSVSVFQLRQFTPCTTDGIIHVIRRQIHHSHSPFQKANPFPAKKMIAYNRCHIVFLTGSCIP